jgi:hypothetical protein
MANRRGWRMSLAEFAGPNRLEIAAQAALISSILQSNIARLGRILGAGLVMSQNELHPFVVIAQENTDTSPGMRPLSQVRDAWEFIESILGSPPDWLSSMWAFVIPSPEPYIAAGDPISSPNIGTVGCQASWTGGAGFLTAGHVAPTAGVGVFNGRVRLGTVKYANNPAGSGTAPQADISVVELPAGTTFTPRLGTAAAASPNSSVIVRSATVARGTIMALCSFVYWPRIGGTYGDSYLTTTAISAGGDSGSAVVDANTNAVIGLVVGGSAGMTTFIQDVRYQVAQAAALGGLAGLTV